MKQFSRVLLSLVTAALIIFMMTACATQPAPEVIEPEPAVEEVTPIEEPTPVVEKTVFIEPVTVEIGRASCRERV